MLNVPQRKQLLTLARESIAAVFAGKRPELAAGDFDADLRRPSGAFVTLTEDEDLRGCIGSIEPVAPLYMAVSQSAISAAFRDPRFHPLQSQELPGIEIEISVMGPIEPVAPLYMAVSQSAISAAFRDPRFHPLQSQELPGIEIEISVMGPIERVADVEEIQVGRDGLIIRRGG